MRANKQEYQYTESGLSNVRIEGLLIKDDAGEQCVVIPNIYSLHRLIAKDLLISQGRMRGSEIKFIRTEMGLSPAQLGKLMNNNSRYIKQLESAKKELSPIDEAWLRHLAMEKLGLNKVSAEEILGWCKGTRRKKHIRLQALQSPDGQPAGQYQLVA